jgi:Putative adhesin
MKTWDFDTPGPVRLNLTLPIGTLDVETVEGATTTHVQLDGTDDVQDLIESAIVEARPRGSGHEVFVEVRRRSGFFISFGSGPDLRLRVACPPDPDVVVQTKSADVRGRGRFLSAEIKTASGDINLDTIRGDLRVKTAAGDFSINEAQGPAHIQSTSGDVQINQAGSDITVQAVSGDVWIHDAAGSARVNTVSGDQRLDAVVEGTVETHAVSGDIIVGVRRGSSVYVDANTISGSTTSELDLGDAPTESDGDADTEGPMVELRAKTVSGDIAVTRAPARTTFTRES